MESQFLARKIAIAVLQGVGRIAVGRDNGAVLARG
jgi:hypothetical protein